MKLLLLLIGYVVIFTSSPAWAQENTFSGHLKYQGGHLEFPEIESGGNTFLHTFDARLNNSFKYEKFEMNIQAQALALESGLFRDSNFLNGTPASALIDDKTRLFDLSSALSEEDEFALVTRLDRLWFGFAEEHLVLRVGRQAISIGNGLAFHVLDILNPFSPTAIDKEYKTGDDLLYAQYLLASGDDLQLIAVPRRDIETRTVKDSESSLALKYHASFFDTSLESETLFARHYDANVGGLGLSHSLFEAIVRGDVSLTNTESGRNYLSIVINIDRSFVLRGYNLYVFLEYFRNGLGVSRADYATPNSELRERLLRGELFTVGKDYLAKGIRLELNPLLNLYVNNFINLHDQSGIFQIRPIYDLTQDLRVSIGLNQAYGSNSSEFAGHTNNRRGTPSEVYLRAEYYF